MTTNYPDTWPEHPADGETSAERVARERQERQDDEREENAMDYDQQQIEKLRPNVARILGPGIETTNGRDGIRQNLSTVTETVYNLLPSGDYGRGDVKRTIESIVRDKFIETGGTP